MVNPQSVRPALDAPGRRHSGIDSLLKLLFRLVAAFSLRKVHEIGGLLGKWVYWLSPTYRNHLRDNLAGAGYSESTLVMAAAAEAGRQALETPWIWMRPRSDIVSRTEVADMSILDAALADGRPVMFLPPHLGYFEVTAQFYAAFRPEAKTRPMTVLYRIPRKSALRGIVESGRAAEGLRLAPAETKGVRMLMKAMKNREVVGILPDQVPSRGEGAWAPPPRRGGALPRRAAATLPSHRRPAVRAGGPARLALDAPLAAARPGLPPRFETWGPERPPAPAILAVDEHHGRAHVVLDRDPGVAAGEVVAIGSGHGPDVRTAHVHSVEGDDHRRLVLILGHGPALQVGDRLHARPARSAPR